MSGCDGSHARRNLLTGEWVLVSPHRNQRPWLGQLEPAERRPEKSYDPACYLCPKNDRANGEQNPDFTGTYVFDNDFSALSAHEEMQQSCEPMFETRAESGRCRVVCYSERHDVALATMEIEKIAAALDTLTLEFQDLDRNADIGYVQIFENRGQMMGCSNQHPHAQIWATHNLPNEPAKEFAMQHAYYVQHNSCLLRDYLQAELRSNERVVLQNEQFVAVVPYWATWPFETLILPRRHLDAPDQMSADEVRSLAVLLKAVLSGYDRLFGVPAPYSMGIHPRPSDGRPHPEWLLHLHIHPPLLRSASIRKYLVGFEMFGMPQRDLTPELAAEKLRACVQG